MAQKVRDVMTPRPVTVPPDALLIDAAEQMRDQDIGDVLVLDEDGRVRGIVTDRDIVVRALADGQEASITTVEEVCSPDVLTIDADEEADQAVRLMSEHAVRRIPVIDDGLLVGVVSLGDLAIERDPRSALGKISAAEGNV